MWRGTLLHELWNLPLYWQQVSAVQLENYQQERIQFGNHNRQYCLVLRPDQPVKAWVMYWHGGGWQFGTPEKFSVTARPWLKAGYGVVLPSYRRIPFHQFESIREDTVAALAACHNYWQGQENGTTKPVVLLGMSAGGHLASLVGLDQSLRQAAGWQERSVAGVVAAGAVLDLDPMRNNPLIRLLAGKPGSSTFRYANPVSHIHEAAPPFLLIHGRKDGMTPFKVAARFERAYAQRAAADRLQFITLNRGSHLDAGRWMFLPGSLQNKVLQQAEQWLADIDLSRMN